MIQLSDRKINQTPRFFMLASVPLALFLLLLLGYGNIIPLKVELHSVIIIFLILLIFISFISHNAWYSFAGFKNALPPVLEEVDSYLLDNQLFLAKKKKAFGNIKPFFENYVRSIRNDNFASIATSIFPTLGILGTFTAIAISMPDFSVESKEALESEITILLSGVGTAFYASIYGIFLSIWWIFFEKRGLTKIQNELDDVMFKYKDLMWDKDEIELYRILENQEQNQRFLEKIENVVTPEYITSLDSIAKEKLSHIEKLDEEYRNSEQRIAKSYIALIKLFEETSKQQETLLQNFGNIQNSIEKTSDCFKVSIDEQEKNSKALRSETYSMLSSLELVSSDLKSLGKELLREK